ncbi:hypothetical protein ABE82_26885 (plasmid) [Paenibacillus peoriae]|uniref:ATP-binding protein n=1 Tax=Paenibacillus peoriae TaxID=59893 RepID=UPI00072246BB|nr:ATP-binding protein [Paenibacillus peoriae]ALS10032.1 hypothetical protein ABE82_26885 [Paenibacillus peoriae]
MDLSKKPQRVNIEFPIAYFERNLIFTHSHETWAIYEMSPYVYDHLSDRRKLDKLFSLTSLLGVFSQKFHLLWLPEIHNISEHHDQLRQRIRGPIRDWAKQVVDYHEEYLKRIYNFGINANNVKYKAFVVAYLPKNDSSDLVDVAENLVTEAKKMIVRPKRLIEKFTGLNAPEIYDHEFQTYLTKEQQMFSRIGRKFKLIRGTERTTEWLIKRNFWLGIADPELRSTQEQTWSPKKTKGLRNRLSTFLYDSRQVLTLTEGDINLNHPRRVSITQPHNGEEKTIHHTYLTVSELPDELEMPDNEWLYSAALLPFPIQMSIKVDVLEPQEALTKLSRKKMEIENQINNIHEANATVPEDLADKHASAHYLEADYKKTKNPTFLTHVTFGLYHTDLHALRSNAKILQDHFKDAGNIQVAQPAGDQWLLFNDFIPGSPRYVSDYIQRIPPETLAASMIGATQELGDEKGLYIGTTGDLARPVYMDPGYASKINRSPSIVIVGTLGGGKSVLGNLLSYICGTVNGGKVLILDPKNERTEWPKHLTELTSAGQIQVTTLSSGVVDQGKLDPFIMLNDIETAKEVSVEILSYLSSKGTNTVEYSYISRAVQIVASEPNPYLTKCIDTLFEIGKDGKPEATLVAEILESYKTLSFAKLLFGTGEEKTMNLDCAINILQVANLQLPDPDKLPENYSLGEKMSVGLMFAIARFAEKFIYHDRGIFKYVTFDEAWAILSNQAGKAIGNKVVRTGRSLNGGAIFITQNATDVSGDLAGNIGVKFAFRDDDTDKIKSTLSLFGLEHVQSNIDMIRNLNDGQCLMQDIHGRVGILDVDLVFTHLEECFDTRPPEESEHDHDAEEAGEFGILQEFQKYIEQEHTEGMPYE